MSTKSAMIEAAFRDPFIRQIAHHHSKTRSEADDALQLGLESCLRWMPDELVGDEAMRYITVAVKRAAWEVSDRRERQPASIADVWGDAEVVWEPERLGPHQHVVRAEETAAAWSALRKLSRRQALVVVLKAAGYSYEDIVEATGWSWRTVERQLVRARRNLRKQGFEIDPTRK